MMNLSEVILNCNNYIDSDEMIFVIFAKKIDDRFDPFSDAVVLELTTDEMDGDLMDITNSKCPGYDYFLEMFILQDFFEDIRNMDEYRSDNDKVKRVIYYGEFDA